MEQGSVAPGAAAHRWGKLGRGWTGTVRRMKQSSVVAADVAVRWWRKLGRGGTGNFRRMEQSSVVAGPAVYRWGEARPWVDGLARRSGREAWSWPGEPSRLTRNSSVVAGAGAGGWGAALGRGWAGGRGGLGKKLGRCWRSSTGIE